MNMFARAVEAVLAAEIDLDGATLKPQDAPELVRAVLMAVRDDLKDRRVHTDGYRWTHHHSGPFILWDEIDVAMNEGCRTCPAQESDG